MKRTPGALLWSARHAAGDAAFASPGRARKARSVLAAAVTATLIATTAALTPALSASAALGRVGPTSPAGAEDAGFPAWYADTNGLALSLCLDGAPNCFLGASEFLPVHQSGGDAEAFYFTADAEVGPITVHNALEAAFAGEGVDQEVVFVRSQIAAQTGGLVPGAVYTVTDPYGTLTDCIADGNGQIRNNACRTETTPVQLDFNRALNGRIGPFLTWDTFGNPALGTPPPAGYIGDSATPHKVVGSPTGFNKVRVEGPGINADGSMNCSADYVGPAEDCAETDLFAVQGKVHPGPSAALSSSVVDFGNTATAATQRVTFTSTGSTDVTVDSVTASGSADFAMTDTCAGAVLAPSTSCTIDVTYTPAASGSDTGAITVVDSTTGSPRTIQLKGSSLPSSTVAPASVSFGSQKATTTSASAVVTIGNSGVQPLTVDSATIGGTGSAHFKVVSNDCTVVPVDGGCEIAVAFAPTSTGDKTAALNVATDGGNRSVPLTGTGTAPVVAASPTSLTFADQTTGTASTPRSVTVTNSGNAPVTIDDLVMTGADGTEFALAGSNTCTIGTNLVPNSSCVVQVAFRPTTVGAKSATLAISADGAAVNVALSGSAVAPPDTAAPSTPTGVTVTAGGTSTLNVSWTASNDNVGVTGYRVFKNGSTTPVATVTTGTSFSDTGLAAGSTHGYQVAAIDAAGNQSASSASVSGTTLTVPGTPTIGAPTAGNASATVRWGAPTSNGGSAITGYSVRTFSGTTLVSTTPVGAVTSTVITGLTNGTAYTFDVAAVNAVGTGAFSARSTAVTPAATPTDTVAPTVTGRTPAAGATSVANNANVTVTFSEAVTGVSGTTVTLRNAAGAAVPGTTVTYNATTRTATLNPGGATTTNMANDTTYTVSLTAGIRDAAGNPLAATSWTFITGPAPTISARTPGVNATAVARNTNVTVTFSEAVTGLSASSITVQQLSSTGAVVSTVTGTLSYNATTRVGTFNPFGTATTLLAANTRYRVNINAGIRDNAGNPLAPTNWTFTTGAN